MTTNSRDIAACLICGAQLTAHQRALDRQVCHRAFCQWRFSQLDEKTLCEVCGLPLARMTAAIGVCDDPCCRRIHLDRQRRREQTVLWEQAERLRDERAPALGIADPETYIVGLVPAFEARMTNLPERRKRLFRDRLTRVIGEAMSAPRLRQATDRQAADGVELGPMLGLACARCGGYCCRTGANHAFISPGTIRRYLATHPGQRPRHVLDTYLSYLGNKTYEHSCVFHRTGGCALPRALRSDTCNLYFCDGLQRFLQDIQISASRRRGFILSASRRSLRSAAFLENDSSLPVSICR